MHLDMEKRGKEVDIIRIPQISRLLHSVEIKADSTKITKNN
jgi:hypothetical protein